MLDIANRPPPPPDDIGMAAEIVAAYVTHNSVPTGELPALLRSVHETLASLASGPPAFPEPDVLKPAVPIKKSVHDEFIVCLENGKRFKSLKRHLATTYGLSPEEYRAKWGLPKDYPMVAPAYAQSRSNLARQMGLGRKTGDARGGEPGFSTEPEVDTVPEPGPEAGSPRPAKPRGKADAGG